MAVVTALRATRSGGVALHVDGEYLCTVSESLVARWRLFKGRELGDDDVSEVRRAASAERAGGDAYRLLGHRARSRSELRRRLLEKGHDEQVVSETLDRLEADGFLDDAAFARSYVADKRNLTGWGAERIRRSLAELGVSADIVAAELDGEEAQADDELSRALAFLRRRGPATEPLDAARRRAYQALLRRGFTSAVAYSAIRRWTSSGPDAAN